MHNPLLLHPEPGLLTRESLCTFPTVGSILTITYDQGIEKNNLQFLDIGKWIKIVNMRVKVRAGLWHGVLTPYTKLRYTPNGDHLILERQRWLSNLLTHKMIENIRSVNGCFDVLSSLFIGVRLYDERMSCSWRRMPSSSIPWSSSVTGFTFVLHHCFIFF